MEKNNLFQKEKRIGFLIALVFILMGAGSRLLPHPPNFAPITAIALFSGVFLSKKVALILPLIAMVISDKFIGFYDLKLMSAVYGSFLLCVVLGFWIRKNKKWYRILGGSVFATLTFFFLTNFSFWLFTDFYVKTISGLIQCYLAALPFLRNSFLGDLTYVIIFFGVFEMANVLVRKILERKVVQSIS